MYPGSESSVGEATSIAYGSISGSLIVMPNSNVGDADTWPGEPGENIHTTQELRVICDLL